MSVATVVTQKGATRHAVYELRQFLYQAGRAYGVLQTDQEPAVLDLARALLKEIPGLSMRASPTYNSQSLGAAERYHQSLHAQARTLRLHVHNKYGTVLLSTHAVFPWLIRRASWLLSRYLVHSDGLTSYQRRWGRNFESGLCEFAETVQYRDTGKQTAKLTLVWELGLWLGRDTLANEVLVATPTGVKLVRSVRRLVPSEKCSKALA